jgi:hypothetical protein
MAKTLDELVARKKAIKSKMEAPGANVEALQGRLSGTKEKIQGMKGLFAKPGQSGFDNRLNASGQQWADSNYQNGFNVPAGAFNSLPHGAETQDAYNIGVMGRQDDFNRPNEFNPYGSQTFEVGPDGRMVQRTSLSPEQQQILDQQQGLDIGMGDLAQRQLGGVESSYSSPFSLDGIGNDPRNIDFSADRRRIEDQISGRFEELNADRFSKQSADMAQSMADRGIDPNSKWAEQEKLSLSRQQEDARRGAQLGAIGMGGEEMQRSYSMSQDARGRSIDENILQRDRPYTELSNILGSRQGVVNPNFQARSNIDVPNIDMFGAATGNVLQTKQNEWQGGQNAADRALQEKGLAMQGAGTMSTADRIALVNAERDAAIARDNNQLGRPPKPSGPPTAQPAFAPAQQPMQSNAITRSATDLSYPRKQSNSGGAPFKWRGY